MLEVTFPDEWLSVATRASGSHPAVRHGLVGNPVRPGRGARFADELPALDQLDFDGRVSLALVGRRGRVQAFCAIGVVSDTSGDDDAVRAVVEGGPHPGLDRDTVAVELELGRGLRSSAFRFAENLLDDGDTAPFTAEVRFAFPLPGRRIGVLHFETLSLGSFEELECAFDVIAGTARLS